MSIIIQPKLGGWFKLTAIRPDGRERPLTGWFPNLITDVGLNRIGQGSYMTACHVGTDNTTPTVLDTALSGYLAGTTTLQYNTAGAQTSPPYYGWRTRTYRFAQGAVVGNVAEVGIATAAANGGSTVLFSRALVLDELGSPTTVTVLADEVLDVTYQLRLYVPTGDVPATITISGFGNVDTVTRAALATSAIWGQYLGSTAVINPSGGYGLTVYSGTIGTITSQPSGTSSSAYTYTNAYANLSYERTGGGSYGLNTGNVGGIGASLFSTSLGYFQTSFSPAIPKDSTKTLSLTFKFSWARYTP